MAIETYFRDRELDPVEGIWTWDDNKYQVAIVKDHAGENEHYDYIAKIIRADSGTWKPGQVKLLLNSTASPNLFTGVYYARDKSRTNTSFVVENFNLIAVNLRFSGSRPTLIRDFPVGNIGSFAKSPGSESHGTCFIVAPDGVAVTSHHVVAGAESISVILPDERKVPAVVESTSAANDIAVLRLAAKTPEYLGFASTRTVQLGEQVFTIGFPSKTILGADAKFTEGSVSALSGVQGEAAYMQVSIPIQPGNSGGPVVDHNGNVLGVIAATAAVEHFYRATGTLPQNVNWAVKSDYVQPMLELVEQQPPARDRNEAIARVQASVCEVIATH